MKQCPVCSNELYQSENTSPRESYFICTNDSHANGVGFSAVYDRDTEEILYFSMQIDKYCVRNDYKKNKTNILIEGDLGRQPFLYLPLVHFELYNVDEIKKKLKLLIMMY